MHANLVDRVRRRLADDGADVSSATVAAAVRAEFGVAGHEDVLSALRQLRHELVGLGPLADLVSDDDVTDVLVTAPDQVWTDGAGGLRRSWVTFPDEASVRRLAQRLAHAAGRRLDDAQPFVDGWLPAAAAVARVRLHAVLPPIAAEGTCLSLRVLRPAAHNLAALTELGTVNAAGAALLRAIMAARLTLLVSGGTGAGKSTLLGALLGAVAPAERIVSVEDAGELEPDHPQFVRLVARPPNVEGAGEVTLRELVRQALRMRPDRLVLGEVRGAEVCELLAALNTGHEGGAGTLHANCPAEVPARLEALAALGGLSRAGLHSQVAAAVRVVLHMRRHGDRRVLAEIGVPHRCGDEVEVLPAWRDGEWTEHGELLSRLLAQREVELPC
ncbi:TadA family conjugal transfer-associated ATPase [Haloechinothrix halophila]|uniref:TadA family conjugal transfer-associated ATPase n=1 Tax=Haloechinothrix halophila TaxID=1069073 RepID=UPI0003FAC072|nr:TadA family conjugal transfer-associated ATPase [Haloechinothrix halophila]